MFGGILHTPMRFFDENSSGRILNRISSDMGSIDTVFPITLIDSVANVTNMCGILIVIIISDPYMIGVVFTIIVLYGLILKLYLRASQDLKRLQGICEFCNNERISLHFPINPYVLIKCFRSKPYTFTFDCNN